MTHTHRSRPSRTEQHIPLQQTRLRLAAINEGGDEVRVAADGHAQPLGNDVHDGADVVDVLGEDRGRLQENGKHGARGRRAKKLVIRIDRTEQKQDTGCEQLNLSSSVGRAALTRSKHT